MFPLLLGIYFTIVIPVYIGDFQIEYISASVNSVHIRWYFPPSFYPILDQFVIQAEYLGPCTDADVPTITKVQDEFIYGSDSLYGLEEFSDYYVSVTAEFNSGFGPRTDSRYINTQSTC